MDAHVRAHPGEKAFACPFCLFECTTKSDLKRHMVDARSQSWMSMRGRTRAKSTEGCLLKKKTKNREFFDHIFFFKHENETLCMHFLPVCSGT
jgi:uncharacterized C2H2 Zn-finger protein